MLDAIQMCATNCDSNANCFQLKSEWDRSQTSIWLSIRNEA